MNFDFKPFFKRYEAISALAELLFDRVSADHPSCINCQKGCDECCYALFDLTLIEALYINHKFNQLVRGEKKNRMIERANRIDRQLYKVKKKAFKELNAGKDEQSILLDMAQTHIRCPLLSDEKLCGLYEYRPITCKLYGVPTAIGGAGYSCGKSNFSEGLQYPTVNLDPIQKQLYEISSDLVVAMKSKHIKMAELLVPVSMALLTEYDEIYLGITVPQEGQENG